MSRNEIKQEPNSDYLISVLFYKLLVSILLLVQTILRNFGFDLIFLKKIHDFHHEIEITEAKFNFVTHKNEKYNKMELTLIIAFQSQTF